MRDAIRGGTIWSARMRMVLRENRRFMNAKRSSRLDPSRSITKMLKSPSVPHQCAFGIPTIHLYLESEDSTAALEELVDFRFVEKLRMLGLGRLLGDDRRKGKYELDGYLFASLYVDAYRASSWQYRGKCRRTRRSRVSSKFGISLRLLTPYFSYNIFKQG